MKVNLNGVLFAILAGLASSSYGYAQTPTAAPNGSGSTAGPVAPSWERLAGIALKLDQTTKLEPLSQVDSKRLIAFFMPAAYAQYNQNVFKMNSFLPQAKEDAKSFLAQDKTDQRMLINTSVNFDKDYNFTEKEYPFSPFQPKEYFTFGGGNDQLVGYSGNAWPQASYEVFFTNTDIVNGIKMPEKVAESFLNGRTQNGFVNTGLNATVIFHITGFKKVGGVNYSQQQFLANIDKVILYRRDGKVLVSYKAN